MSAMSRAYRDDGPPQKRIKEDSLYGSHESPERERHSTAPSRVLHCRGLRDYATQNDIVDAVKHFGRVTYVMMLPRQRQALIEFEHVDDAAAVVNYSETKALFICGQPAFFNFSTSDAIKRPASESNVTEIPENKILLFTILNPKYPITVDVMHTICSPHGEVKRIVVYKKHGVQSMVEFDTIDTARKAMQALNGCDVYSGCCTLKIEFAKPHVTRLNVFRNDKENFDYTTPNPGGSPQLARSALLGDGPSASGWDNDDQRGNTGRSFQDQSFRSDQGNQGGFGGRDMNDQSGMNRYNGSYSGRNSMGQNYNDQGGNNNFGNSGQMMGSGGGMSNQMGMGNQGQQGMMGNRGSSQGDNMGSQHGNMGSQGLLGNQNMGNQGGSMMGRGMGGSMNNQGSPMGRGRDSFGRGGRGGRGGMRGGYNQGRGRGGSMSGGPGFGAANDGPVPGSVLLLYGLGKEFNCERLFNIFCTYGNVFRIKFLRTKEGSAMVNMGDPASCERAVMNLNHANFFSSRLQVQFSKQDFVQISPNPHTMDDGTPTSIDFSGNRNNRFFTHDSVTKTRFSPPTKVLHFFNAPTDVTEQQMIDIFTKAGARAPTRIAIFPVKSAARSASGLIEFSDVADASEGLVVANHSHMKGSQQRFPLSLKMAFSASPIIDKPERGPRN